MDRHKPDRARQGYGTVRPAAGRDLQRVGSLVGRGVGSAYGIAHHVRRALDVDTSHPIIMCQQGFIMDGWHRVLRALIDGKTTIKAVRFVETPPYDYLKAP